MSSSKKNKKPAATGAAPNAGGSGSPARPSRSGGGHGGGSHPQIANTRNQDQEAVAIMNCLEALKPLQPEARHRVMQYVGVRFKLEQQQTGVETVSGADEGARTIGAAG